MALSKHTKTNFATLKAAFAVDSVCVLECQDKATGKPVSVLCAVNWDGKEYSFSPFAKMFDGNPYDELNPPNPDGGFHEGD